MSALSYLARTKLKNQLKSLIQKPGRLLYVLFLLAFLILALVTGSAGTAGRKLRSKEELTAIGLALYALMFLLRANAGFSQGGNLFRLSDVNFLFTAPLRPQAVLFYGLLQQMAAALLLGFFLLFQYSWLHSAYGVTIPQLLWLLTGYALSLFLGQVTAMVIYIFTCHSERRQRWCQAAMCFLAACFLVYLMAMTISGGPAGLLNRAVEAANSPVLRAFPVAGWLSMSISGVLTGSGRLILLGAGLCALYLAVMLLLIFQMDPDFYEDVLQSAEITQSAINAKKEGAMSDGTPRRVNVGRKGLSGGIGASAFFFKHRLESRRAKRFLLNGNEMIFALVVIVFAVFTRDSGLLPVFLIATYFQLFTVMTGRLNLELSKPYLYLVPEPPMKKLLWSLMDSLPTAAAEAVVIFIPIWLLLDLSPAETAACILARLSYTALCTAANVAVLRLWGGDVSSMLLRLLFMLIFLGAALPGILISLIAAPALGSSAAGVLGILTAVNLPTAWLVLFLCRNMLQYAELNHQ